MILLHLMLGELTFVSDSVGSMVCTVRVLNPPSGPNPLEITATDVPLPLTTAPGVYKSSLQLNLGIIQAMKEWLNRDFGFPITIYDQVFLSGGMISV